MFERHGEVEKFLMPPEAAVSALIVMGNAVDAKKAFKVIKIIYFNKTFRLSLTLASEISLCILNGLLEMYLAKIT